jgi:hypothetical protein
MTNDVNYVERIKENNGPICKARFKVAQLAGWKPGWWWSKTNPGGTEVRFKGYADEYSPNHVSSEQLYFTDTRTDKKQYHWRVFKPEKKITQALEIVDLAYSDKWVLESGRCVINNHIYVSDNHAEAIVGAMLRASKSDDLIRNIPKFKFLN